MSKYGIQNSFLTDTIVIGTLNEAKDMFLDKEDHTANAVHAVADHVARKYNGNLSGDIGKYSFEITVKPKETN